jgi:DNA-binding HxlR family transcriptional regulator
MCPRYERAVQILGKRWTALIVRTLLPRPRRFSDMTSLIPGLSDRLLSERLKELESCGIVERRVFAEMPVRIEYTLTGKGRPRSVDRVVRRSRALGERLDVPVEARSHSVDAQRTALAQRRTGWPRKEQRDASDPPAQRKGPGG